MGWEGDLPNRHFFNVLHSSPLCKHFVSEFITHDHARKPFFFFFIPNFTHHPISHFFLHFARHRLSSRNVSVLTSFRRQSPPIATEKFCERKNESKRECCVRFIISPLCNLFLIIIIVIIFTVLAIRFYFLPIFILFRSVTFLPFVRFSFLFIFCIALVPLDYSDQG